MGGCQTESLGAGIIYNTYTYTYTVSEEKKYTYIYIWGAMEKTVNKILR